MFWAIVPDAGSGLEDLRAIVEKVKRSGWGLATAAALVAAVSLTAIPNTASARGGIGTGAAVGIGLGAFALGSALGAGGAYGYPYYAPAYAPRSCWDPYYRRYYAC